MLPVRPPRTVAVVYLFALGAVLVAGAYYRLGILGTYLGDHFGILMKSRIESFPFNYFTHPMYEGSSLIFIAYSLWYNTSHH